MATPKKNRWGLWIIVILLIIGLGGWYTGGAGGRTDSIGTVGGLEIGAQDYANALRNEMRGMEQQTGETLAFADAQAMGLDRAVLARLVTQRTLDAEAHRLGLSVGDERVARAVLGMDAFQGLDGQFDRELYRESLQRNGLNEEEFERSLREDTARTILQAAVVGALPEPTAYGETIAAWSNEARTATWAALSTADVAVAPEPAAGDLQAFYDANPDRFTAPETREVSYAWITPAAIQDAVPVDDAAVRALYDERIDQFVQEERRLVERLVMPSEEAAQAARAQLDAGEATFEDLVAARNLQLSDVDLGDVARDDLDDAADPVFAAQPGDVVGPLPTALGPALFRVNAVLAADETPFEEAAPALRAELADAAAREAIVDLLPEVEDLVAGGATTADLAERTDLEPGTVALTQAPGEGPAAYEEFRAAAFAKAEGGLPEIVELGDGGLAVLSVDAVTPPTLRPFAEVEADVRAAWEAEAILAAVRAQAEAAAEAIVGGASFEDQGLSPATEENLTRRSQVEGTAPGFAEAVFALAPGEARTVPTETGALVVRLDAAQPADPASEAVQSEAAAIAQQVQGSLSQDLFDAFARTLQTGSELRIDDRAVAAVNAQFN